jgi:hypothetical protein
MERTMKPENQFEERLRRQSLRQIPSAWREEIIANARAVADAERQATTGKTVSENQAALIAGWRLIFARLPLAWASLAALWIAIIGVNLMLPTPMVSVAVQDSASDRMAELAALDSTALDSEPARAPQPPASEVLPATRPSEVPLRRPRSERRQGMDFGEASPNFPFDNLV